MPPSNWSPTALHCYENGGDCRLCDIPKLGLESLTFEFKDGQVLTDCAVKNCLPAMLKKYGEPTKRVRDALIERLGMRVDL